MARILIVDDEPNLRLMFRTALESSGYAIDEAADGVEALARLGSGAPGLILLDLHMPRLDGMATLRQLRESGHDVPVVIVTAHGSVPDAVAAMKLGAIDFLPKPITPDALRRLVSEVIRRHAASGPRSAVEVPDVVTAEGQYDEDLSRAKRALNNRRFDQAEVFLKQAIGLRPDSAEAHNLLGVLYELRGEYDACYREYKAALSADARYAPAQHNMTRHYELSTFGRSTEPLDLGGRP